MKMNQAGFLLAIFALMFLLTSSPVKAENLNEASLSRTSFIPLQSWHSERSYPEPVQAILNKEEAEAFLSSMGIYLRKKTKTSDWNPFNAARILQISA